MTVKGLGDLDVRELMLRGKEITAEVRERIVVAELERSITGASIVDLALRDADRKLVKSEVFNQRTTMRLDGLLFELVRVGKSVDEVQLQFESAGVADLRRKKGLLVAKKGTTTRTKFAARLVSDVKWLQFKGEAGVANLERLLREKGEDSWECLQRLASDRNWRCFENEGVIWFGSDDWLVKQGTAVEIREHEDGVDNIDFSNDTGRRAATATVTANIRRWASRPGAPVSIRGLGGMCDGVWLVESIRRSLFREQGTISLVRKTRELPEPKPDTPDSHDDTGSGASGGTARPGPRSSSGWQWPCGGSVTSGFGPRRSGTHYGVDIGAPTGTPIKPGKPGTVIAAGYLDPGGYGNAVYIDHGGGVTSRYAHMSEVSCRAGQDVGYSDVIGRVGSTGNSTGPHLHFEIRAGGAAVDPMGYLP